jgi:hypothetical protein
MGKPRFREIKGLGSGKLEKDNNHKNLKSSVSKYFLGEHFLGVFLNTFFSSPLEKEEIARQRACSVLELWENCHDVALGNFCPSVLWRGV